MRKVAILTIAALAVIAGAWYVYFEKPMASQRRELRRQIQVERQKVDTYQKILSRFDDKIEEYQNLRSSTDRTAAPFSGENEIIGLYESLDSLCHRPGYRLEEITPSLDETVKFLRQWADSDTTLSMPIRIKINADFRSLADLIRAVERYRNFTRMKDCRVQASDKLFPDCALDMTFIAGLGNRKELFDRE